LNGFTMSSGMLRPKVYCGLYQINKDIAMVLTLRRLFDLTKGVYERMPRELCDIIYQHLLSKHEIDQICRSCSLRLDNSPLAHQEETPTKKHQLPDYADPKKAYRPFVCEIIAMVYESHRNLCIEVPSAIPKFMRTDFFKTGMTPRDAKLSGLQINGCLDSAVRQPPSTCPISPMTSTLY